MSVFYSQNNPAWKNLIFGFNSDPTATFGKFACLITGWANMLNDITGDNYTPVMLNDWVKASKLYVAGTGVLYWSAIPQYGVVEAHGTTADVNAINQWLVDPLNYALVEFNNGAHFSLANKVGLIIDSIDGKQKPLTTYKVTLAHLFRAIPGRGTISTSAVTSAGGQEVALTGAEETEMYVDLAGRQPEITVPSGRTGIQWVRDFMPEYRQRKQAESDQLANAAAQVAAAMGQVTDLQSRLDAATKQLLATRPDESDFTASYQESTRVRHAAAGGVQIDFGGEGDDVPFVPSTVFTQAGTFVVDGVTLVRTQKSVDLGTWYGTLEDYFDDEPTDRTTSVNPIHATASMASGLWQRLKQDLLTIFKRKK